ncbi:Cytidine and dCMP deaminase domain-containing protein 1 [Desmophyllum pertusum]|uniref:dCMP deaminase n=1 Tax=Desmophyllum pertusum TaxID=174260 RepID=A0A9X0A3L2_9CNID|nr:Cytidine and dCMP deaminase domain-containing protein 1 [Desmophyllum pertusum]
MNQTRTRSFANFVNTITKTDLYSCLALWMEESPLATTSVCDFESSRSSVTCCINDQDVKPIINEDDTWCGVAQENGPLRKKLRRNNCTIEEKDKSKEFVDHTTLHDETKSAVSCHLDNSTSTRRQVKAGYCEEHLAINCTEANGVDEEKQTSKSCSSKLNKIGVVMVDSQNPDEDDLEKVEKLYRMSEIGQSIYVPNIQKTVLSESEIKRSPYAPTKLSHTSILLTLLDRYWSEQWKSRIVKELNWPEFIDCKHQVDHSIHIMLEWIARVTFGDLPDSVNFYECGERNPNSNGASSGSSRDIVANHEATPIIPDPYNPHWQELARHMSRMANILAQRSNDPKRGVGAIILQRNQVVSACWNGYPPKAGYGDFPRASHIDGPSLAKKYAFSIHAEQAAILGRNVRDVSEDSSTLFVSKTPCDECVPLILKAGIKNAVFPRDDRQRDPACLRYALIQRSIALGQLNGFESRLSIAAQKDCQPEATAVLRASSQLCFNGVAKELATDATK